MEAIRVKELRNLYHVDNAHYNQVQESIREYKAAKSNSKRRYGLSAEDAALADSQAAFKAAWNAISPFVGEDDEIFSTGNMRNWKIGIINVISDIMDTIVQQESKVAAQ